MKRSVRWLSVCMIALFLACWTVPSGVSYAETQSEKAWHYTHVVMSDGVHLRYSPRSDVDNILVSMRKGRKLRYISKKGNWWKVALSNGRVGYCYSMYVGLAGYSVNKNYYSPKKIKVYKESIGSSSKGWLKAGMVVKLLGKSANRGYIRAVVDGEYRYGYVNLKTLRRA